MKFVKWNGVIMNEEQGEALYYAVQSRPRPEDVADLVEQVLGDSLTPHEFRILEKAAIYALRRQAYKYSSMAQDFWRPTTGVAKQIQVAEKFGLDPLSAEDSLKPDKVLSWINRIGEPLHKFVGFNNFKTDRLATKIARREAGIFKNGRWYNKRWRLLNIIERKIRALVWNQEKYEVTRLSKSSLATKITKEDLMADNNTACFVAYMSSRMGLRSTFTNTSQVRAFDEIADMLMACCKKSETTRWDVMAMVIPDEEILTRMSDRQKGVLLGKWLQLLVGIAGMLEKISKDLKADLATMVVSRGQDSSTWNQAAGGWNVARSNWISVLHALKMSSVLDYLCPGKVMRLMAADVVRWQQLSGKDVHPDTKVWAALPPPWKVLRGEAQCGREDVERACTMAGVDSEGWTGPRKDRRVAEFIPTPELVHGVSVSSPELAAILRKAGDFSGKEKFEHVPGVVVVRDEHGAAIEATNWSEVEREL